VPSPDGALDAVVIAGSSGANTPPDYYVYVVKHGATLGRSPLVMQLDGPLRSDNSGGVDLRWLGTNALAVEYQSAVRVTVNFTTLHIEDRDLRIIPHAGVSDSTANSAERNNVTR
jgi:hypothetical protein